MRLGLATRSSATSVIKPLHGSVSRHQQLKCSYLSPIVLTSIHRITKWSEHALEQSLIEGLGDRLSIQEWWQEWWKGPASAPRPELEASACLNCV